MKYDLSEINLKMHVAQLETISERLEEDITNILNRAAIYFRVFGRVKSPRSLFQKLSKNEYGFGEGDKRIQDVLGLRVVVYYNDDVPIVREILENTFRRIGEWAKTDSTDQEFKASKLNGVFRVPDEYIRTYSGDLADFPVDPSFEVQLRTVSFEGWHEIEHDMRYKSPYGARFWEGNEDLSRTFNSVLANLELCDWTTVSVFNQLAYYHYEHMNWEMMLKSLLRLRFSDKPLDSQIVEYLNKNTEIADSIFNCDRKKLVYAILKDGSYDSLTYNRTIKIFNESLARYEEKKKKKLAKICAEVVDAKPIKKERLELNPLEVSPSFNLNVVLLHDENNTLLSEFLKAVDIIGTWAQGRFQNITTDIPNTPDDYEFHLAGYNLTILGNVSLGFYKLTLEHVDITRQGVVWQTEVSLEMSDKIRMRVKGQYCHKPERLVRDAFSKPRFVDDIFKRIGYEDVVPLDTKPIKISAMPEFEKVAELASNTQRTLPVIVVAEDVDENHKININRLAETVGTYAHVYVADRKVVSELCKSNDYNEEEIIGSVWISFSNGEQKFYTRQKILESRFDFNKYAFDEDDSYEKAFRHKLVRLIKEKNC